MGTEKKPSTPVIPAHVATIAQHQYRFELWRATAIFLRWTDATIDFNASLLLWLSGMADPTLHGAVFTDANGVKIGATGGTVDLSDWEPATGFVFTGAGGTAVGSESIILNNHGMRWALLQVTFTAGGGLEGWVPGYN